MEKVPRMGDLSRNGQTKSAAARNGDAIGFWRVQQRWPRSQTHGNCSALVDEIAYILLVVQAKFKKGC
jgi:hypothetical protein